MASPLPAARPATSRAVATSMVEESISSVPAAAAAITPWGAPYTSRTCAPAGSMVMTASAPTQAAPMVSAASPPSAESLPASGLTTSKPTTACRALTRLAAIGKPMLPRPMNAMRAM